MVENKWQNRIHGVRIWVLAIISIWLAAIAIEISAEIFFTSAGNNYLGLSFWQSVRWFFVEWSFVGYIMVIVTLWLRKLNEWFIILGMICYVLLFANYINGEWSSYWFSFGSVLLIAVYIISVAVNTLKRKKGR